MSWVLSIARFRRQVAIIIIILFYNVKHYYYYYYGSQLWKIDFFHLSEFVGNFQKIGVMVILINFLFLFCSLSVDEYFSIFYNILFFCWGLCNFIFYFFSLFLFVHYKVFCLIFFPFLLFILKVFCSPISYYLFWFFLLSPFVSILLLLFRGICVSFSPYSKFSKIKKNSIMVIFINFFFVL